MRTIKAFQRVRKLLYQNRMISFSAMTLCILEFSLITELHLVFNSHLKMKFCINSPPLLKTKEIMIKRRKL